MADTPPQRTRQVRVGGSFAPPLTDAKLAAYKATIAGLPASPVKDALVGLLRCCEKWWELPEPEGTKTWAHPSGLGTVVAMQDDHAKALWDDIPWNHELDALGGAPDGVSGLFDTIEAEVTARNSEKVATWTKSVLEHLQSKHMPAGYTVESAVRALKASEHMTGFLTADQETTLADLKARVQAFDAAARAALSTKTYPDIPYPTLEPTAIRDMAFHLLWHVRELNLDREPLTADRL